MPEESLITTIRERCRMCYTCVRECPAKAIRIVEGQAEIVAGRCIACGNCVRVCSRGAKTIADSTATVRDLLTSGDQVAALVAPSFPAEFAGCTPEQLAGMLHELGFDYVHEVAFGADIVAREMRRRLEESVNSEATSLKDAGEEPTCPACGISANCPAVVGYVERYATELTDSLEPVVSPMVAMARFVRMKSGPELKTVFLGPCLAKKAEMLETHDGVDAVLTFAELRKMFTLMGLEPEKTKPKSWDGPSGALGGLYPLNRGAVQAAGIPDSLLEDEVVSIQGREEMIEAIDAVEQGELGARLLESLCCDGCVMGAGVTSNLPMFHRRRRVQQHVAQQMKELDVSAWNSAMEEAESLDLSRAFEPKDRRLPSPSEKEIQEILARMNKLDPSDELNCGSCGYNTCREHACAVHRGLAEIEMCLPNTIAMLRGAVDRFEKSHHELSTTQNALIQSEKTARMGQMASAIAHELNNPLGVVLMYSHLLAEEAGAAFEAAMNNGTGDPASVSLGGLAAVRSELKTVAKEADRCKTILGELLEFARQNRGDLQSTDVRDLLRTAVECSFIPERIAVKTAYNLNDPLLDVDKGQMVNVITNLLSNAVDAIEGEGRITLWAEDRNNDEEIRLSVSDSGAGIPDECLSDVFEPFYTTKPTGNGTGLGMAVIQQTVKMHDGRIEVHSNADPSFGPTGTTFVVVLPRNAAFVD
jgi:signal transduction histidine kinase/Fe-S-cluster-containing hydrogenase component 2